MALTIKYYSFKEKISGKLSKDYGWDIELTTNNIVIKIIDGIAKILKDEPVTRMATYIPSGDELTEITKKDFDGLEVPDEPISASLRREKNQRQLIRLETQSKKPANNTIDIAKKFEEFNASSIK